MVTTPVPTSPSFSQGSAPPVPWPMPQQQQQQDPRTQALAPAPPTTTTVITSPTAAASGVPGAAAPVSWPLPPQQPPQQQQQQDPRMQAVGLTSPPSSPRPNTTTIITSTPAAAAYGVPTFGGQSPEDARYAAAEAHKSETEARARATRHLFQTVHNKLQELGEACTTAEERVRQSQSFLNQSAQDIFVLTNRIEHIMQKAQALRTAANPSPAEQQGTRLALPPMPPQSGAQPVAAPMPWSSHPLDIEVAAHCGHSPAQLPGGYPQVPFHGGQPTPQFPFVQ
mmetsp:Transcript_61196/g.145719  ORF Transcript_61196/g.145719 Transcript_61196/m.145719 type:complete len:282 (-) Transcript_61196:361-1206(-)